LVLVAQAQPHLRMAPVALIPSLAQLRRLAAAVVALTLLVLLAVLAAVVVKAVMLEVPVTHLQYLHHKVTTVVMDSRVLLLLSVPVVAVVQEPLAHQEQRLETVVLAPLRPLQALA
jgi:hypothetical protein